MKVLSVVPRGYCKGVVRAINIVKESVNEHPLYILGMIVHNEYIVNALSDIGAITIESKNKTRLELLDEIDHGTVIITAHGAGDNVKEKALSKGLNVIDASCADVIKTHDLIKTSLNKGYEILYIGKHLHPEAEGAMSINPKHMHLIQSTDDIEKLDPRKKYLMTNQTTMSLYDVYSLCEKAKELLDDVTIAKETCTATQIRQEAIASIDEDVDLVIIVGDPHSNNTKKLASIASNKAHKETIMIGSIDELDVTLLNDKHYIAISSGASTPTYLTNQIIDFIKQYEINDPTTHIKPQIDYTKILK